MLRFPMFSWVAPSLLALFILPAIAYGGYSVGDRWYQNYVLGQEEAAMRADVQRLRETNARLQRELEAARGDAQIEKAAREQLGLIKPGDRPIQIVGPPGARAPSRSCDASRRRPSGRSPSRSRPGCACSMPSSDADPVTSVRRRLRDGLARARLLISRTPLVVAVSGGADSLCLLDALVAVRPGNRGSIVVGHVDHRLRDDSKDDARHVEAVAAGYGLRCETISVDVRALARDDRLGIEEAGRVGRYRALSNLARDVGASAILTGHTRTDSVETLLLHLLRGSGLRGLRGIEPVELLDPALAGDAQPGEGPRRALRLVRPLLDVGARRNSGLLRGPRYRVAGRRVNSNPTFARTASDSACYRSCARITRPSTMRSTGSLAPPAMTSAGSRRSWSGRFGGSHAKTRAT